ncbi:MAG: zinc ribbon domain-containing protein [Methanobrevibacter sp.]|jgi:hypothetical protein|nr:zinc ribbon domain-containing protein [Methanobrevibacter sp.]
MVKKCSNCGHDNADEAKFCLECGNSLESTTDTTSTASTAPVTPDVAESKSVQDVKTNKTGESKTDSSSSFNLSSLFYYEFKGEKKPRWGVIGLSLLIIVVIAIGLVAALGVFNPINVNEEINTASASYTLKYSSEKSSQYTYKGSAAYAISYNGKFLVKIDTSKVSNGEYLGEVLDSYSNGGNDYNATIDSNFTAYNSKDSEISTNLFLNTMASDMTSNYKYVNLIKFTSSQTKSFADGILTLSFKGSGSDISSTSLSSSLKNIDYIKGTVHIYNYNARNSSDPGFYNYTLNFVVPSNSITVKKT